MSFTVEVVPFSEGPLSEVPLHVIIVIIAIIIGSVGHFKQFRLWSLSLFHSAKFCLSQLCFVRMQLRTVVSLLQGGIIYNLHVPSSPGGISYPSNHTLKGPHAQHVQITYPFVTTIYVVRKEAYCEIFCKSVFTSC